MKSLLATHLGNLKPRFLHDFSTAFTYKRPPRDFELSYFFTPGALFDLSTVKLSNASRAQTGTLHFHFSLSCFNPRLRAQACISRGKEYSGDPAVKFGFCRGLEPVNYVSHILERFEHYKQFVVV